MLVKVKRRFAFQLAKVNVHIDTRLSFNTPLRVSFPHKFDVRSFSALSDAFSCALLIPSSFTRLPDGLQSLPQFFLPARPRRALVLLCTMRYN
jgi:hypothetical protein